MRVIAVDTETGGLDWWLPEQQAFMVTWSTPEGGDFVATDRAPTSRTAASVPNEPEWEQFYAALQEADAVVFHNAKFDLHQLRETWGIDLIAMGKKIHDTELLAKCIAPQGPGAGMGGYGLKNLAKIHLARANDTEERIKELAKAIGLKTLKQTGAYRAVWEAYPDAMAAYAMDDTRFTLDLFDALMVDAEDQPAGLRVYEEIELPVLPILLEAERVGVALDQKEVRRLRAKYQKKVSAAHKKLVATLGAHAIDGAEDDWDGPEIKKTEALREALLEIGVPLYRRTETGILSTNKFALQEFEHDFPILRVLSDWRTSMKFLATYLDAMKGVDEVHTSFRQIGAWTGRMSCTRPNMQNLPKGDDGVRSVFVPRPGHAFVVCDYASIEAFILAHYLGSDDYRRRVEAEDPHAWMASMIHYGTGSHEDEFQKGTPGQLERDKAKNTTYAIAYGAGAPRVTDMNGMDPKPFFGPDHPQILAARAAGKMWPKEGWQCYEAKDLIKRVKSSLPGFYRLQKRIREKVQRDSYVTTHFGRKQVLQKEKAYVGLNALIQGTAADVMKRGMVNVQEVLPDTAKILLIVHDELVIECLQADAPKVLQLAKDAMVAGGDERLKPQLQVEGAHVTTNYGDAK